MNTSKELRKTVLAVDPSPKGFGFAILEDSENLIEWGVKEVSGDKNAATLKHIANLIEQYQPDVVVTEDCDKACRRGPRVQQLIRDIGKLSTRKRVKMRRFPGRTVRTVLSGSAKSTKHEIATIIAQRFIELSSRLPPPRKPWVSETERMEIFDAVSLAMTFFRS